MVAHISSKKPASVGCTHLYDCTPALSYTPPITTRARIEAYFRSTSTPAEQANACKCGLLGLMVNPADCLLRYLVYGAGFSDPGIVGRCAQRALIIMDPMRGSSIITITLKKDKFADFSCWYPAASAVASHQHGTNKLISPCSPTYSVVPVAPEAPLPPALIEAGIVRNVASCRPHWLIRTGADQLNGPSRTRRLASLITSAPHWTSPFSAALSTPIALSLPGHPPAWPPLWIATKTTAKLESRKSDRELLLIAFECWEYKELTLNPQKSWHREAQRGERVTTQRLH
ncbi:uncharacterized protein CLUP02_13528 [Colletotrichum lupini]|uniref:Uncharacterized protein n=1 Tax=Colletotrichum lupini TaxID=145971 RepID=A0A9Q8T2J5_9PEZI|nr:uncharacterized protein CLUP02_13528 [Colletotrichum lupini]UQC88006.1 hypothetical protein CLUP02_13528 [Colletotrichum lupini]